MLYYTTFINLLYVYLRASLSTLNMFVECPKQGSRSPGPYGHIHYECVHTIILIPYGDLIVSLMVSMSPIIIFTWE